MDRNRFHAQQNALRFSLTIPHSFLLLLIYFLIVDFVLGFTFLLSNVSLLHEITNKVRVQAMKQLEWLSFEANNICVEIDV